MIEVSQRTWEMRSDGDSHRGAEPARPAVTLAMDGKSRMAFEFVEAMIMEEQQAFGISDAR